MTILQYPKTGSTFLWKQSLKGVGDKFLSRVKQYPTASFDDEMDPRIEGIMAGAVVKNEALEIKCRIQTQRLVCTDKEIVFACPTTDTLNWEVGKLYYMGICFGMGTPLTTFIWPTVILQIEQGFIVADDKIARGDHVPFNDDFNDMFYKGEET